MGRWKSSEETKLEGEMKKTERSRGRGTQIPRRRKSPRMMMVRRKETRRRERKSLQPLRMKRLERVVPRRRLRRGRMIPRMNLLQRGEVQVQEEFIWGKRQRGRKAEESKVKEEGRQRQRREWGGRSKEVFQK